MNIPSKIDQKSSQNEAWEGPGGSWGWSWSHFGSLGATGWQPLVRWPPFGRPKGSLWDQFSKICVTFWCFCVSFFRSSVLKASGLNFAWILGGFRNYVLMCFWCVSGASITKENVVSIHYLLRFKHITPSDKGEESIENQHLFEDTSGKGLGIGFDSNSG